jgi:hypothetical protein
LKLLDSRFRGNDEKEKFGHFTISLILNLEFGILNPGGQRQGLYQMAWTSSRE